MRAKARNVLSLILIVLGSQVAYPQNNFPQNLISATDYWSDLLENPVSSQSKSVGDKWGIHSERELANDQLSSLKSILELTDFFAADLSKEDQKFLTKYGYLATYLSGMNPAKTGSFDRAGIWMLSYPEARRYGLEVNEFVDERRDIAKSTKAARLLFNDLKKIHGEHTEAAFIFGSAGHGKVLQELIDQAEADLLALRLASKGVESADLIKKNSHWLAQQFQEPISTTILLADLGILESTFQKMNPTIVSTMIPQNVEVLLPKAVDGHMLASETKLMQVVKKRKLDSIMVRIKKNIPSPESHQVITYRVKSGDVLGRIAEHYGVGVSKIKKWNNLRSDRIDINQKLTIYYPKGKKVPKKKVAKATPKPEGKLTKEEVDIHKFTIYEVQQGDTLWAISKKFVGVEPEDIMKWNAIGEDLSIGQKLKIKSLN